jgi:hypothetical protein
MTDAFLHEKHGRKNDADSDDFACKTMVCIAKMPDKEIS